MIGERPSSGADAGAAEAGEFARARAGDVAAFTGEAGTGLAAECYYRAICRFFEVSPQT